MTRRSGIAPRASGRHLAHALILLSALVAACGAGDDTEASGPAACSPGAAEACSGADGCAGQRVCLADASSFGPCECGTASSGADSGAMAGGGGGTAGAATGAGGGAGGSAQGAGGGGGVASAEPATCAPAPCDPATQVGCAPGQKCTLSPDESVTFVTACCPVGTVLEGEACEASGSTMTADNCVAGQMCGGLTGVGQVQACHAFCTTPGIPCADCYALAPTGLPVFSKLPLTLGLCP